jgi:hypothetical protein
MQRKEKYKVCIENCHVFALFYNVSVIIWRLLTMGLDLTKVCWEPANLPGSNAARILAQGYTLEEVEEVLHDPFNDTIPSAGDDFGIPHAITRGRTRAGRILQIVWVYECGNPLMVSPLKVIAE